jgi:elongation factor P
MMKINGNAVRPGYIIEHKGRLWVAVKIQHTQPGKGGAYLQVELKDIRDGTKLNERFRSSESVERVRLDERPYQFLFGDEGSGLTFMDQETYDQVVVPADLLGDGLPFLEEGMMVTISSYEGDIVSVSLPDKVTVRIRDTEPVLKGQTAASSFKPAILENGVRVMVPPHIDSGTLIVVSTGEMEYVERAKE